MDTEIRKFLPLLLFILIFGSLHIWYEYTFWTDKEFRENYIEYNEYDTVLDEDDNSLDLRTFLSAPIYLLFWGVFYMIGKKYEIKKRWKHYNRDFSFVLIFGFLITDYIIINFLTSEIYLSVLVINFLIIILIIKVSSDVKKRIKYNRRKKELSIFQNKIEEYIKVPEEKEYNLPVYLYGYGNVLIIDDCEGFKIISELNYFLPDKLYLKPSRSEKITDPAIIILFKWINNDTWNNYYNIRLTFINFKESKLLGRVIIYVSDLEGFSSLDESERKKKLLEEVLFYLNNFGVIYRTQFLDSFTEDIKNVTGKWENGNLKYSGQCDVINHYEVGNWKYFYENGNIEKEILFKNGSVVKKKEYWENGNLKYFSHHHKYKKYNKDGTLEKQYDGENKDDFPF